MKDTSNPHAEDAVAAKLLRREKRKAERKKKRKADMALPDASVEAGTSRPLAGPAEGGVESSSYIARLKRRLKSQQGGGTPRSDAQVWRWNDGRLTFFNLDPRGRHVLACNGHTALEAEEIPNALVSRQRDRAMPPRAFSGAVYRSDGHIVPEFMEQDELLRHRWNRRMNVPVVEGERIANADTTDDICIYLGRWSHRFEHFLLESLSRAWYLADADRSIPVIFHSWGDRLIVPPFASAILNALDVEPSRIRIVSARDLRVGKLILPSSQFWPGVSASPGICKVFDHVRERMLRSRARKGWTPEKIYLSQRTFETGQPIIQSRLIVRNEQEAEAFFRSQGYEILRPELMDFEGLVEIVANATHVAGLSGPALHMMLFNANPQARLIELRTTSGIDQLLISSVRGQEAFHVSCLAAEAGAIDQKVLDLDVVERAVREIG